ncbi:MAG: PepSY domain-containing protein [Rhodanobacteraceae bacterium]
MATNCLLKSFRTLHLYFGVFTAPALLFFAFTGGLQSLSLHEASRGGDYQPPRWLASISHLHKKQSLDVPVKRPSRKASVANANGEANAMAATRAGDKPSPAARQRNLWPMKVFFVLVSLSLFLSTVSGVYMGWRYARNRRRYGATLAAGVAVPVLLLFF